MSRRYLFLCPDAQKASGGVAVLYDCVTFLREAGYDAAAVHQSPDARYPNQDIDAPVYFTPEIRRASAARQGLQGRLNRYAASVAHQFVKSRNLRLELRAEDLIVAPDFMLSDVLEAFPDNPKVLFVQNPFVYTHMHGIARGRGLDPVGGFIRFLGIADICMDTFELLGAEPVSRFPVSPNLSLFPFRQEKKPLITYMPRKRPQEAAIIDTALRQRGRLGEFDLVAIDRLPQAGVAGLLGESLVFLSLLKTEALGFPAAEAMAAGCITIGYTGLGTREYFDETTGIPVEEGDTMGVVRAVEQALEEYRADPSRLDDMRKRASERIHQRYSRDAFRDGLLEAIRDIETDCPPKTAG